MANDNPQYLWGRKNPNWNGPSKANQDTHVSGGRGAASGDFGTSSSGKIPASKSTPTTPLKDIDLSGYTKENPYVTYGGEEPVSLYADGNMVHVEQTFKASPQGDIDGVLEEYNMLFNGEDDDLEYTESMRESVWEKSLSQWAKGHGWDVIFTEDPDGQAHATFHSDVDITTMDGNYGRCDVIDERPTETMVYETDEELAGIIMDNLDEWKKVRSTLTSCADSDEDERKKQSFSSASDKVVELDVDGRLDHLNEYQKENLRDDLEEAYYRALSPENIAEELRYYYDRDVNNGGEFRYNTDYWRLAAVEVEENTRDDIQEVIDDF